MSQRYRARNIPPGDKLTHGWLQYEFYAIERSLSTIAGDQILSNTITTTQIADNAISTPKLQANSVITSKLAAHVITTDKLFIGSFDNIIPDGGFEQGDGVNWSNELNSGGTFQVVQANPHGGAWAGKVVAPNGGAIVAGGLSNNPAFHPHAAIGDQFYFEIWARKDTSAAADTVTANIQFRDANGTLISDVTVGGPLTLTTGYQQVGGSATAPANTAYVLFYAGFSAGFSNAIYLDDFYARKRIIGSVVVDGTITALQIAANTITVDRLFAGVQDGLNDAGDNRVINGGGEQGALGSQAPGWTFGSGNNLVPTQQTGYVFRGSNGLQINNASANDSYSYQDFTVVDGEIWEISGWVTTSTLVFSGGQGAGFNLNHQSGGSFTLLERVAPILPGGGEPDVLVGSAQNWTRLYSRFRVNGSGTVRVYLQLGYGGNVQGTAGFDEVVFRRSYAITTEDVLANAITATKIQARSISTRELQVGNFDNLCPDPGVENTSATNTDVAWTTNGTTTTGGGTFSVTHTAPRSGNNAILFDISGQTGTTDICVSGHMTDTTRAVAVTEGDSLYFEVWARKVGVAATASPYLYIRFLDYTGGTVTNTTGSALALTQTYQRMSVTAVAPATAAFAQFLIEIPTGSSTNMLFDDAYARRGVTNSIIVSGTITADRLNVTQLSAIAADIGTVTAGQLHNAGNDAGILLSGTLPGGWTRYLDLVSSDVTFLKHDKLTLNYDGTATFSGSLKSQVGGSSATAVPTQFLYGTQGLSHTGDTTNTSLGSFSLPASAMQHNGDVVRIVAIGHTNNSSCQLFLKFGSTTVFSQLGNISALRVEVLVTRTGASSQDARAIYTLSSGSTILTSTSPAETLSSAVTIDFRGQCGLNTDTVFWDLITIEYLGT